MLHPFSTGFVAVNVVDPFATCVSLGTTGTASLKFGGRVAGMLNILIKYVKSDGDSDADEKIFGWLRTGIPRFTGVL
jgi:hypothetical protein